jgi:uncharacterized protein YjbI with pentapeptide repeats
MSGASLEGALLQETALAGANLTSVNFNRATITNSDFGGAVLNNATFADASLEQVSLNGAWLLNTQFAQADFVGPESLDTAGEPGLNAVALSGASYDDRTTWPEGFVVPLSVIYHSPRIGSS